MKKPLIILLSAVPFALANQAVADTQYDVGQNIYQRAFGRGCGTCHDYPGNPPLRNLIKAGKLSRIRFEVVLREGKFDMPKSMAEIMSMKSVKTAGYNENQAVDAIYNYLKPSIFNPSYAKFNDTGIQKCSNLGSSLLACPLTGYEEQDGDYGRDAQARKGKLAKTGGGKAGFDFTKIANDGSKLPVTAKQGYENKDWACTADNATGLVWEVKPNDGSLRDKDNTYSWYSSNTTANGGFAGYKNGGNCTGSISCDTSAYLKAINEISLCGKKDWRIPSKQELISIANYNTNPLIDTTYFPNKPYSQSRPVWWSWSSSPYAGNSNSAWLVDFLTGETNTAGKSTRGWVMLVRGKSVTY